MISHINKKSNIRTNVPIKFICSPSQLLEVFLDWPVVVGHQREPAQLQKLQNDSKIDTQKKTMLFI